MSGHSKWSTIRRKKGAADAKRGQIFTKYAKAIALAAEEGANPETNFKLRLAIDRARSINMPAGNIAKAVARGSGQDKTGQLEEVIYEGYGPAGIALMVRCATDNKNRTSAEVRSVFTKHGGNLAEPGAVAYQFQSRGIIQLETNEIDQASLVAIDSGALDIEVDGRVLTVYTDPKQLSSVQVKLEEGGVKVDSAELGFVPTQAVTIGDSETAKKIVNLLNKLDDLADVISVYSNFDIPAEILESA